MARKLGLGRREETGKRARGTLSPQGSHAYTSMTDDIGYLMFYAQSNAKSHFFPPFGA